VWPRFGVLDGFVPPHSSPMTVLEKRYLRKNAQGAVVETPDEMFWRVHATLLKLSVLTGTLFRSMNCLKPFTASWPPLISFPIRPA